MSSNDSERDLIDFEQATSRLTRLYQFRDRDSAYRFGISVSQACLISVLGDAKQSLTMKELAQEVQLDVSSATRAVDGLVKQEYLKRGPCDADRRVVRVVLTTKGKSVYRTFEREWIAIHRRVLDQTSASSRRSVIKVLRLLAQEIEEARSEH